MVPTKSAEITTLLKAWSRGDPAALDRLTPLLYDELRRLAHRLHAPRACRTHAPGHGAGERGLPAAG